jgi:kynurenine 3-monooxygenase
MFSTYYGDKVALIVMPVMLLCLMEGMNAGFEDISILYEMMEKYGEDWETVFSEYEKSRRKCRCHCRAFVPNFLEMSSKLRMINFLHRKKIEKVFSDRHPDKWIPLYSRVTFSDRPYLRHLLLVIFKRNYAECIID